VSAQFLLKIKIKKNGDIVNVPKSCGWLKKESLKQRKKVCKKKVQCVSQFGSPQDVCPEQCKFCGMCKENKRALFFLKQDKKGEVLKKKCGWLKKRPNRAALCKNTVNGSCHGLASEVCPTTCFEMSGCTNSRLFSF